MSDLFHLQQPLGSYLGRVDFYRRPDGTVAARIIDMPDHVIEAEETIAARFGKAANWLREGSVDLLRQGVQFEEPRL